MNTLRFTFLLLLLLAQHSIFGQQLNKITQKYTPYLTELQQGIGVLVQQNGKTEAANIGSFSFNEHTVFNIGSATKKFTAVLLLQEAEKGNLKLSDSIGTYLQPIKNVDGSLTIETLLRHQSGLGELVGKNFERDFFAQSDSLYNADFLQSIPKSDPKKVGKYHYCNTNYILLGHLLEHVTDKSYNDLLRERIFIPSGMTDSYPYVSKGLANLAPPMHGKKNVIKYLDYRFFAKYAFSAGSIASTLNDVAKFYQHLFEKHTLLSPSSVQQLIAFDDNDYALGLVQFNNGYIGHGGNNLGYAFREYYNPTTKKLILFFSNARLIPFGKMLKKELLDYCEGKIATTTFNKQIADDFKHAVGKYQFDTHGMKMVMEIVRRNNHLYFAVPAQKAEVILVSKEKNKLYNGGFGVELEVKPNTKDEVIFRQNGLETVLKRIKS